MQGSWGFIVGDHEGDGVLTGAGRLGSIPNAMTAEAAAYAQALQAAADYGISHVQVEVDSTALQQALQSSSMDLATCGMLLSDTRSLLCEQFVYSKIISIPRACNGLAHNLAKLAMSWDPGDLYVWAYLLPEFVNTQVARNLVQPVFPMKRPQSQPLIKKRRRSN